MKQNNEILRGYIAGDEKEILNLFENIYGYEKSINYWKWKYADNYQGAGWITLAEAGEDIVGHYCIMQNNLNCMGKVIIAGQSCDTMIRKDNRGKGLFIRLATENYNNAINSGVCAVFGFPNRNSLPGFMRDLGWCRIAILKYYNYRLGFKKLIGKQFDSVVRHLINIPNVLKNITVFPIRLGFAIDIPGKALFKTLMNREMIKIEVCTSIPSSIEDLLKERLNYEVVSVWKDVQYLKWRYENHPENKYVFHILYIKDRAEAIVVCREKDNSIAICEIVHRSNNVIQTTLLLNHVINYYVRSPAQKIEFYGFDNGFYDDVFKSSGFNIQKSSRLIFGGRVLNNNGMLDKVFCNSNNWSISYGDTDII